MNNPFGRPTIADPQADIYTYYQDYVWGNGARQLILKRPFSDPPLLFRGPGRLCGSLRIVPETPVMALNAGIVTGIPGIQILQPYVLQPLEQNPSAAM